MHVESGLRKGGEYMNTIVKHVVSFAVVMALVVAPSVALGQWDTGLSNAQTAGTPGGKIVDIIKTIMNYLLGILGFLGIIGFVISGIMYLVSAGDESGIERAKTAMVYSIVGVIVALIGFVIIRAVDALLRASGTSF